MPDYVLDADLPGFWTRPDAMSLVGYLRSDSGRKLNQILKNYILRSAVDATNGVITCDHARGIRTTVALIDAYLPMQEIEQTDLSPNSAAAREAAFAAEYGV